MISSFLNQLLPPPSTRQQGQVPGLWQWLTMHGKKILPARENRRLRVAETVSLGDRRFVVLLEADGQHFLVGASTAGVSLLTQLHATPPEQQDAERSPAGVPNTATATGTADLATIAQAAGISDGVQLPAPSTSAITGSAASPNFGAAFAVAAPAAQAGEARHHGTAQGAAKPISGSDAPLTASGRRHAFPVGIALAIVVGAQLLIAAPAPAAQSPPASRTAAQAAPPARNATHRSTSSPAAPAAAASGSGLSLTGLGSSSAPWTIVVLLTVLTLIPSLMICMTPFARLLVVFHFLRQALGLQTTPSNQTLIGLSLILTFFIMQPLGKQIYEGSVVPLQNGQITALEAVDRGSEPLRHFMAHYVREKDAALFLEIAHAPQPKTIDDVSLRVLMPAYIVSELKAGFQIGAVLFLPFLVVDIVIASITTSVGMMQLPPVVISTPLKLMLFLMVDGWHLLIGALVRSFY